ncbi:hypothetical protein B0T26DRAFT_688166 [Lasiosphaeria miniovina]|uniref:Uncharacterized protein n=1 Tax=Lasiosphaeria miniovina TaxID=1954250 RepID=A0AA40BHJ3_9PEZI|nr:uncharacterized protein B0T26DRAFT_688166 [Lasiosphaeria miniovina]KAK0734340.1 hypothetical protein B0T26DRAFT_688166 [Lasiosphaeria miniovina]
MNSLPPSLLTASPAWPFVQDFLLMLVLVILVLFRGGSESRNRSETRTATSSRGRWALGESHMKACYGRRPLLPVKLPG